MSLQKNCRCSSPAQPHPFFLYDHKPEGSENHSVDMPSPLHIDLNTKDYGGFVTRASNLLKEKLGLPPGFTYKWSGEYEFELRAKERLQLILPVVFFVIFLLLYMVFHSVTEAAVLIFPTIYALTGGLMRVSDFRLTLAR
jgi:Cu(I)/Ag(I) efflux system membrane protein CusA/SilA